MNDSELDLDLDELSSAEDFLDYFGIDYDPSVVHVNRLHILQRFHDYLGKVDEPAQDEQARYEEYTYWLTQAYRDFVGSDAQTEKVFRVFNMNQPMNVSIPLSDLNPQVISGAPQI